MNSLEVIPGKLTGTVTIPPSKSHTQRALCLAMMAKGSSHIHNPLISPDTLAMSKSIEAFGAKNYKWQIEGGFRLPTETINAGNSGQVLRFCAALGALLPGRTVITGDHSIKTKRPMQPLLEALRQLGATCAAKGDSFAICGPIEPGKCRLNGADSQPVSALLMATSFLPKPTTIEVTDPGETPWIDLTLHWLSKLGASIEHDQHTIYRVKGSLSYPGFHYKVPADFSSATYPIVAALITKSPLLIQGLDPEDIQGDKAVLSIIEKMGGNITWKPLGLFIEPGPLQGMDIDINPCIDALPILALLGCFAKGETRIYNGAIARCKESDRIAAICKELKKMGAAIQELPDGLRVKESVLSGQTLHAHDDHRIALTLAVAGLAATSPLRIEGWECTKKTYPTFIEDFSRLGAHYELDPLRV